MTSVVISPSNVVTFPEGGGHFWVYMQYVQGLHQLGCDVYWLEQFHSSGDSRRDDMRLSTFFERMVRYELEGKAILYTAPEAPPKNGALYEYIGVSQSAVETLFQQADLLLNFHYTIDPALLACFKRTALVDIDPGLLQFWMSVGQLEVPKHDVYFSIGETVGASTALFSDCGLPWVRIRPPVCLALWPYTYNANCEAFTTVSGWWGGDGKGEWIRLNQKNNYTRTREWRGGIRTNHFSKPGKRWKRCAKRSISF
ncbi:hypothetical protein KFU94_52585 [Chloroflexi bacterium TSY]|nr:hypothetical protein [Chloroflexi bacterium TSY]